MKISNKYLRTIVNKDLVVCDLNSAKIENEETNELTVRCNYYNGNFDCEIYIEEDLVTLSDKQQDYIFEVLSESLAEHKQGYSESIYDLQQDAMNANNLNY